MSAENSRVKRPPQGTQITLLESITDPVELAKIDEANRNRSGNPDVVHLVLDHVFDPRKRYPSDLVGVILGLVEHLTPEQRAALAAQLPAKLDETANGVTPPPAH